MATDPITSAATESLFPGPMTYLGVRWRTGRKVGRTIYAQQGPEPSDDDPLIGVMDTTALATEAVSAHNVRVPDYDEDGSWLPI